MNLSRQELYISIDFLAKHVNTQEQKLRFFFGKSEDTGPISMINELKDSFIKVQTLSESLYLLKNIY